jgi:hypothetical protein
MLGSGRFGHRPVVLIRRAGAVANDAEVGDAGRLDEHALLRDPRKEGLHGYRGRQDQRGGTAAAATYQRWQCDLLAYQSAHKRNAAVTDQSNRQEIWPPQTASAAPPDRAQSTTSSIGVCWHYSKNRPPISESGQGTKPLAR